MKLNSTGLGYEYFRCRANGDDSTVYVHQLTAILDGEEPAVVFGGGVDVHHVNHVPWDNRPDNLVLEESREHRVAHLEGREPDQPESVSEPVPQAPEEVAPSGGIA